MRVYEVQTSAYTAGSTCSAANGYSPSTNYDAAGDVLPDQRPPVRRRRRPACPLEDGRDEPLAASRGRLGRRGRPRRGPTSPASTSSSRATSRSVRTGVWQWDDKLRPDRSTTSFNYVLGVGYRFAPRSQALRRVGARHQRPRGAALPPHAHAHPGGGQMTRLALAVLRVFAPLFAILLIVPLALAENPAPAVAAVHGLAPLPDDRQVPRQHAAARGVRARHGPERRHLPAAADHDPLQPHQAPGQGHRHHVQDVPRRRVPEHVGQRRPRAERRAVRRLPLDGPLGPRRTSRRGTTRWASARSATSATRPSDATWSPRLSLPRANLLFNHKAHADRNIGCAQCHGAVDQLELATRDQLPRMRGCFNCHQKPDSASRGEAKSACDTCHFRGRPRHAHQDDVRDRDAHAAAVAAQRRAHARLHRAAQDGRRRRLAVLRELPQGRLLHRLPRRARPPPDRFTRATT